jgi:short-subunit dehydrogenase
MAKAVRSLSPKQIQERMQQHRQAVMVLARLAAKRAVQDQLRAQGVRVSLVLPRDIAEKASAYLASHPEPYQQAKQRAKRLGTSTHHVHKSQVMHNLRSSQNQ